MLPMSQCLLVQSASTLQPRVSAHGLHVPPQSGPVSVPFCTPSLQLAAVQVPLAPHSLSTQSVPTPHFSESAQAGALVFSPVPLDPQSVSVSLPFWILSFDVGTRHSLVPSMSQLLLVQSVLAAQPSPSAHALHIPPQSRPVSVPFCTPSLQLAGVQVPLAPHSLSAQSPLTLHLSVSAQGGALVSSPLPLDPQSVSVSLPFWILSLDVGARHFIVPATSQLLLVQSLFVAQPSPSAHALHIPPQSGAVSVPFCTPSLQVEGVQVPLAPHSLSAQSLPVAHIFPSAQAGAWSALPLPLPPQSVSDSVPFFTPSVAVGASHTFFVGSHSSLVQSPLTTQAVPSTHAAHVPPQSAAVSVPSFVPSAQLGSTQIPPVQVPLAHVELAPHGSPW